MLQRIDGRRCVLAVVGADADCIQLLIVDHFFVARVELVAVHVVFFAERLRFARDQIRTRDDLHVRHLIVLLHVRTGDPAGTDETNADFFAVIFDLGARRDGFLLISIQICHDNTLL